MSGLTTCPMINNWSVTRGFNQSVRPWLRTWALASFGYFRLHGMLFNLCVLRLGFGPELIGLLVGSRQLFWAMAQLVFRAEPLEDPTQNGISRLLGLFL
jgi:hypothetical protein